MDGRCDSCLLTIAAAVYNNDGRSDAGNSFDRCGVVCLTRAPGLCCLLERPSSTSGLSFQRRTTTMWLLVGSCISGQASYQTKREAGLVELR